MFTKVQIYCRAEKCCFNTIKESKKPTIVINTSQISSLEEETDWGFCENYWDYPYRILRMSNGNEYLCVLESANKLEEILLSLKSEIETL